MLPWASFHRGFASVLRRLLARRDADVPEHPTDGHRSILVRFAVSSLPATPAEAGFLANQDGGLQVARDLPPSCCVLAAEAARCTLTRPAPSPEGAPFPGERRGRPVQRFLREDILRGDFRSSWPGPFGLLPRRVRGSSFPVLSGSLL